ncbi:hypothetical protein [Marisediminicola senii]|uniref:hypothetical protein n=1 Tax=Marisediminicola senii TaxID=2711233 RepID=UPI0013EC32D1|nr:hypothetical protein [Marisediminicola senii]
MTETPEPSPTSPLDAANLDGHTVESLSDYLDSGRTPRIEAIESSPAAQNALAALARLRMVAPRVIDADAAADQFAPRNDHWIKRILDQIGVQANAGRDIPISHDVPGADLSISEGAVRAIVREVGDDMEGLLVERCRLDGDVETPGAPVDITVEISTFEGIDIARATAELRERVERAITLHVDMALSSVIVRVRDTDLTGDEARAR